MKFDPQFSKKDISDFVNAKIEILEDTIRDILIEVGEEFVADARSTNTYKDQTRNLRGSIGYTILKDGTPIFGNFEGTPEGQKSGRKTVRVVSKSIPKGFALVLVAGMEYAAAVESKGYDVMTSSAFTATYNIEKYMNQLRFSLAKVK